MKIMVDEPVCAYRGHHHAIQFHWTKRTQFGIKVYRLCESEDHGTGYTNAFNFDMGI